MIVSFHPIIVAEKNIICAGREPDARDLAAIRAAEAVILPQGCTEPLYRMARANCGHVFPNLDVRFDFPSKSGQLQLLRRLNIAHPQTTHYETVTEFHKAAQRVVYPVVVKFDWGGQGNTVFNVADPQKMDDVIARAAACENTGQCGVLIQEFIPASHGALRVAVIGTRKIAYWRVPQTDRIFDTSVDGGARIDTEHRPELQSAAVNVVDQLCQHSGLQLAGIDFIFDQNDLAKGQIRPLMLEINYFFGRTGLGGSQGYYQILESEIDRWLATNGLSRS
jgi:ribosomal protein S6--L-glutamate ligase